MNQAKWLSDFKYDVEATPLLWSFDDPEQDTPIGVGSSWRMRSLSSPILAQWIEPPTQDGVSDKHPMSLCNKNDKSDNQFISRNKASRSHSFPSPSVTCSKRSKCKQSNGDDEMNAYIKLPGKTRFSRNANGQSEHAQNTKDKDGDLSAGEMLQESNVVNPTYLGIQYRENEKRRLLSVVKPFPSYLAISSPEKDDSEDSRDSSNLSVAGPRNAGIVEDGEIVPAIMEADSLDCVSKASEDETLYNIEFLSGGIWYSDEEEEQAILEQAESMCAYENPAFEPDASDTKGEIGNEQIDNAKEGNGRRYDPNYSKGRKYAKCHHTKDINDSDSAISMDEQSQDEAARHTPSTVRSKCKVFDDYDTWHSGLEKIAEDNSLAEVADHSESSTVSKIADVVFYDDVAPLIDQCPKNSIDVEDDRTSSDSEFEILSQSSIFAKVSSPDLLLDESKSISEISPNIELVWDAYMPPLTLRWSDVILKQIFDTVERDNEEYVSHIRQLTRRRDFRPLSILQRLCWFDEDTGSVQTLVGVFEYNL